MDGISIARSWYRCDPYGVDLFLHPRFLPGVFAALNPRLSGHTLAIYSGSRLDVDSQHGLVGECDFLLARTAPVPEVRAPLIAVVEAKKNDIEFGLAQCITQMIGARLFNERSGHTFPVLFGCVTTGEVWQFLSLRNSTATIDRTRYYLDNLSGILGVFAAIGAEVSR